MDLKLGVKKNLKNVSKFKNNTTLSHKVRINGLSVRQLE